MKPPRVLSNTREQVLGGKKKKQDETLSISLDLQNSFRAIHENANVNSKTKSLTQSCEWKCIFFGKNKQCWSTVKVKVNTMQPSYFIPIKHFSSIDLVYEWKPSRNKFLDHDEILNQEISKKCK